VNGTRHTGPDVIAHRGASAYAPEHTFAAYDLALEQGATMLELDVRVTLDGELVVLHDTTLLRTALQPGHVAQMSCADLAALDAPLRPLTLDAVLERYGRRARLLVELKDPAPAWERGVADAFLRHGLAERVVVQSFDAAALRRLRAAAPWLSVAPLRRRAPGTRVLRGIAAYAGAVGVWHGLVDQEFVLRARGCGLAVRAWTVNDPRDMHRLLALGVDGVITDRPDVLRDAIGRDAVVRAA